MRSAAGTIDLLQVMLFCGVLSPVVYLATDRIAGRLLRHITGGLLIANAALGLIATLFFPTRFGVRPGFGSPGVIIMFLSVVCFVPAMLFGAAALGGWIRVLSIAIPAGYVLLAVLRLAPTASPSKGQAESLIGAQERTMVYSFLLWVTALAIHLLMSGRGGR